MKMICGLCVGGRSINDSGPPLETQHSKQSPNNLGLHPEKI